VKLAKRFATPMQNAMIDHANATKAFDKNRERLRAERLAREAGAAIQPSEPGLKAKGK
jgi:hypothetical protein